MTTSLSKATQAALEARKRKTQAQVASLELIPNDALREFYVECVKNEDIDRRLGRKTTGTTWRVCHHMMMSGYTGYMRKKDGELAPYSTKLLRKLGLVNHRDGKGNIYRTAHVPYDEAVALADGLAMDYVDAGV
jgi:hypothetical protein